MCQTKQRRRFKLIANRYEHESIIITSNHTFRI
ncbi:ATP-binding protein [Escherichia coli]